MSCNFSLSDPRGLPEGLCRHQHTVNHTVNKVLLPIGQSMFSFSNCSCLTDLPIWCDVLNFDTYRVIHLPLGGTPY